jgi:hypothetical protein
VDVDSIFDAIGKASRYVLLMDERGRKLRQLAGVQSKTCGNCGYWMTRSCIPEKQHGQFKSCNSMGCKDFKLSDKAGLIPQFTEELRQIDSKIAAFKKENAV